MRLLLLGDTHCSQRDLAEAINFATAQELDAIFQVGDFGYWPRNRQGADFLQMAYDAPLPIYWLPGNHEDWDIYDTIVEGATDFVEHGSMRISPRVHSWEWDGLRFGVLGGAYSVDHSMREEGFNWFPQELTDYEHVAQLPNKLDILLTHEAPMNLAKAGGWAPLPRSWNVDWAKSNQSQDVVWEAVRKTQPELLVHGHWHYKVQYKVPGSATFCQGLDQASGMPLHLCSMVLDTETRALYDLNKFLYGGEPEWQGS